MATDLLNFVRFVATEPTALTVIITKRECRPCYWTYAGKASTLYLGVAMQEAFLEGDSPQFYSVDPKLSNEPLNF